MHFRLNYLVYLRVTLVVMLKVRVTSTQLSETNCLLLVIQPWFIAVKCVVIPFWG